MSSWNYRVLKRVFKYTGQTAAEDISETLFSIHEVYYDDEGKPHSTTVEPVVPTGNTPEELADALKCFVQALNQPILDYDDDFPDEKEESADGEITE